MPRWGRQNCNAKDHRDVESTSPADLDGSTPGVLTSSPKQIGGYAPVDLDVATPVVSADSAKAIGGYALAAEEDDPKPDLHSWRRAGRAQPCSSAKKSLMFVENGQRVEIEVQADAELAQVPLRGEAMEFRDQLRAIWLRTQNITTWTAPSIATHLGRSEAWVQRCWNAQPESLKVPKQLPAFISDYELRMLRSGVEPFRPAELHRKFLADCSGLYQQCVATFPWEQAVMRQRNQQTGEVTRTDIASNRQDCTIPGLRTGVARIDAALERARQLLAIEDPGAYLTCNWYPDGSCNIAPHRHDFWTAILCFGASRLFQLEGDTLLLNEGDLLVFGTHRHSVPKMPDVVDGRVSVCIFWYPERRGPTDQLLLTADRSVVEGAQTGQADMTSLVLQALAQAGLGGEVVSRGGGTRAGVGLPSESDSGSDVELAAALERSFLER